MPGFQIHLAVAKRYIDKNSSIISDVKDFYHGVIDPDLTLNKDVSHYTFSGKRSILLTDYLSEKVDLYRFLEAENIDTDFQKGIFIHLITDYLFFNYFFDKNYLSNVSHYDFSRDLYYSYDVTNPYIEEKYQIDYLDFKETISQLIQQSKIDKNMSDNEIRRNILPYDMLDTFIEYVSDINLENYRSLILEKHKNVLPNQALLMGN